MKKLSYIIILFLFVLVSVNTNAEDGRDKFARKSTQSVTAGCLPASAETNLDLNNVRALILAQGTLWEGDSKAEYEIPKGSLKTSLYAGGIWVGGVDINGQLRTCAREFRSQGNDYWPGPLITSGEGIASTNDKVCIAYDKHFKITRQEVEDFKKYSEADAETRATDFADYSVPEIIREWPAHGPIEYGAYDYYLAPFKDVDGDNTYNWENGDYPNFVLEKDADCKYEPERRAENLGNNSQKLFGDMTIWWVYNDKGNIHTTSIGAAAIGMEFRAQAFAFSTNDELNNMTFYNYQIINRSTYSLTDAYFGVWNDPDLGDSRDDKAGCDVVRGLGYVYNGDDEDGEGLPHHYGKNPPAIGIDFFEGPYQDPDGLDNLSSWADQDRNGNPDCTNGYGIKDSVYQQLGVGDIYNGNINGLNFGDGIVDNERWGMRRFIYYVIGNGGGYRGDPNTALDFYNYLTGFWQDGARMTYGQDGHSGSVHADFLYPDDTDHCGWGVNGADLPAWSAKESTEYDDMRIVQSAGPFVLEPGAVNDITVGVVWARANSTAWASVEEVRKADIKAQRLFENCFQLIDGPSAPDVNIVELDGKFIFHLSNDPSSNNYLEGYQEKDPFIEVDKDIIEESPEKEFYKFQGYQVYQLKDQTVTTGELLDNTKARQVFQCDVKDGVTQLVNYTWENDLQAVVPAEMVNGTDKGIVHSFEITEDAFGSGESKKLVNYKEYYYIAVAYAYNDFKHYNPVSDGSLGHQTKPYLAGRKNIGSDGNGKAYVAIPQSVDLTKGGLELNSEYGDVPQITMIEGNGGGTNHLELTDETIENILSKTSYPFKADEVTFKENHGPIKVKVIDPINVIDADFTLKFLHDKVLLEDSHFNSSDSTNKRHLTGLILDTKWELSYTDENGISQKVYSDAWIRNSDEKLIPELGISINIEQVDLPGGTSQEFEKENYGYNGFISAEMEESDLTKKWLDFIYDEDGQTPYNWIRSGKQKFTEDDPGSINWTDVNDVDPDQEYEKILGGSWAPYVVASRDNMGLGYKNITNLESNLDIYKTPSVNIVFTKDRSLWTRCPVIEMAENDVDGVDPLWGPNNSLSEGGALKFDLRKAPSRDKYGNWDTTYAARMDTNNPESPNYISSTGMSWFPGYAIDVEKGERLNMLFGEDSWLVGENGNDMLWNPTSKHGDYIFYMNQGAGGTAYFGGKHAVYVLGHNDTCVTDGSVNGKKVYFTMPSYDEGRTAYNALNIEEGLRYSDKKKIKSAFYKHCAWASLPITNEGYEFLSYDDMPDNEVTIKLRMANPYYVNINNSAIEDSKNENYPMFTFSTESLSSKQNSREFAKSALDNVNIVPNPYYGYSEYERTQLDNFVKIINLPERCIVSIFTPNGNLVRKFDKDNSDTFIQWDLKNRHEVTIASGMYIIHIAAPEIGEEKVLKWFGSLRPIDLNAF